jgi:hypothetical protein
MAWRRSRHGSRRHTAAAQLKGSIRGLGVIMYVCGRDELFVNR